MRHDFQIIQGTAYNVEKRNLPRDISTAFEAGTLILHSEVVISGDSEMLEVWLAVPIVEEGEEDEDLEPSASPRAASDFASPLAFTEDDIEVSEL